MSEATEVQNTPAKKPKNKGNMLVAVLTVLLLIAIGTSAYFWNESRNSEPSAEEIAEQNKVESDKVLTELNKILLTESEDEPTVARIEQPQLLKDANPDFYKNVEEGDYLVIYPKRAILFRVTEKRVINVAPIINTAELSTEGTTPAEGQDQTQETTDE